MSEFVLLDPDTLRYKTNDVCARCLLQMLMKTKDHQFTATMASSEHDL